VPRDQNAIDFVRRGSGSAVVGAEGDDVGRAGGAGEDGGWVVVGVGVGLGARRLEEPRVGRGLALLGAPELPRAAVLRRAVGGAGAAAPHDAVPVAAADSEPLRAHAVEVADAPRGHAVGAGPVERRHGDGDVVPVHQAHVVEVLRRGRRRQGDLRQRGRRRAPGAVAVERPAAVARGAAPAPRRVELAPLPPPHAPRPAGGEADGGRVAGRQLHPAARQELLARARLDARPHRLAAPVVQCQRRRRRAPGRRQEEHRGRGHGHRAHCHRHGWVPSRLRLRLLLPRLRTQGLARRRGERARGGARSGQGRLGVSRSRGVKRGGVRAGRI
jgi:hypothetical protein